MNKKPKLVSLFAGCGGLDYGMKQAGFNVVWANDFDKDAQKIFRLNIGEIDKRDIRNVPIEDIPNCDIITAGFPCQPFSSAGNRKGVLDSRGLLYQECLRIIEAKKPKVIVFENVKGLLSSKYIDDRKLVDVIVQDLNDIGYEVTYEVIDATNYEVPQHRQRLIIVGIKKNLGITFVFPQKIETKNLTLNNVLDIPNEIPNQIYWELSPQQKEMIKHIPEGGSWKDIPYDILPDRFRKIRDNMKKYHSPKFYRRFGMNEIVGTITASAQPENCGIIHPLLNRRFTIREIARIQTFPDDFVFITDTKKDVKAMYKVIGNAVPCKLAYHIGKAIKEQVFNKNIQQ